ncbi:MAG: peptidoglycan editing factor PgeF [Sulfurovum sp.]|nr:peptidoglycan editing factor PgeF [Sulfurovum sp.]
MLDFYRFRHFQTSPALMHAVSTKSQDLPYTFSLALHTGEDTEKIVDNRKQLAKHLGSSDDLHFIVANQTHSDHIKVIEANESKGWTSLSDAIEDCDALITNVSQVVLSILTADCVPILLYDPKQKVIAAVHAGWKGTEAKIVAKTVAKMSEVFHSEAKDIIAGIAPSIGKCCYEVGEDVAKHFFNHPDACTAKGTKFMLDLPSINKEQLVSAGLQEKNIEMSKICTACEVERFFSYRKEKGCSGRFMSMITLKELK